MIMYQVSFVVAGRRDVGAVHQLTREPKLGDQVRLGAETFELVDLKPLMPAGKNSVYLQAICRPVVRTPNLPDKPCLPAQLPGISKKRSYSKLLISCLLAGMFLATALGLVNAAGGGWQRAAANIYNIQSISDIQAGGLSTSTVFIASERAGIWKSVDGGESWQQAAISTTTTSSGGSTQFIKAMAVSPDAQTVYAASYGGINNEFIWRSRDGGASWDTSSVLSDVVEALAIFEGAGAVLAGTSETNPVYYSLDEGQTWLAGVVDHPGPVTSLFKSFAEGDGVMYAAGGLESDFGEYMAVFSSTTGITWSVIYQEPPPFLETAFQDILVDPTNPDRLYVFSEEALFTSSDGGQTWQFLAGEAAFGSSFGVSLHGPAIDSQGRLYVGEGDKLYRSANQGQSFAYVARIVDNPLGEYIQASLVDPHDDELIFAVKDTGAYRIDGAYEVSTAAAHTLEKLSIPAYSYGIGAIGGREGFTYAGSELGLLRAINSAAWESLNPELAEDIRAFAVHPADARKVYFITGLPGYETFLYYSADAGEIWEVRAQYLSVPIDVAFYPGPPYPVYLATDTGVFSSADGLAWSAAGLAGQMVVDIAISPQPPYILYAMVEPSGLAGPPYDILYRSSDGGQNWSPVLQDDCPDPPKNVIINPISPTQVYANSCADFFWYDGASWSAPIPFAAGLDAAWRGNDHMTVDLTERAIYAALGADGLYRASVDDPAHWSIVTDAPDEMPQTVFYHADRRALYLGADQGLYVRQEPGAYYLPVIVKSQQ